MEVVKKKCCICKKVLRVESFPRKYSNRNFVGKDRQYIPREDTCSECKFKKMQEGINLNEPSLLERKLKVHVSRCKKRTDIRNQREISDSEKKSREGITVDLLRKKYEDQKGLCSRCGCKMDLYSGGGMGFNLCLEDREILDVWPLADNLLTVDRVDASDPTLPYVDVDNGRENFCLMCFSCNREKYYQEDAIAKLNSRNSQLIKQVEELTYRYESDKEIMEAYKNIGDESASITLLKRKVDLLSEENRKLKNQCKKLKQYIEKEHHLIIEVEKPM